MEDLKIFNRILKLDSLKPSKKTNDVFSDLVNFCKSDSKVNLKKDQVRKLMELFYVAITFAKIYQVRKNIICLLRWLKRI